MSSTSTRIEDLGARAADLERQGHFGEAAEVYAQHFQEARGAGNASALAEAARREGWVRGCLGQMEEAEELVELSRQIYFRHGLSRAEARAINTQANICVLRGEIEQARHLHQTALERAREHNDDELIGSITQNLGVIANIQGALSEARCLYLESIGAAVRSGSRAGAMMAYNNLGMVHVDLHEWMEAEIYFGRGIEISEQIGDLAMRTKLLVNRVEPLIHYGEFDRARELLDQAEEMARQIDDRRALADAARFRGVIALLTGDAEGAERLLEEALGVAEAAGLVLERGEALEEIARLRWEQGRSGAARTTLREARRCFEQVGAANDLRRLDALRQSWQPADAST